MSGHIAFDDLKYLTPGSIDGTGWVKMSLEFRMHIDNVGEFWAGDRTGQLRGDVICQELGDELCVVDGHFRLMIPVDGDPRHQHMTYFAHLEDAHGRRFTLTGYKDVIRGQFNAFEDTTATLTRIHDGWTEDVETWDPSVVATGVLRIAAIDTVTQLFTFRSEDVGPVRAFVTSATFMLQFVRQVWTVYGFGRRHRIVTPR